MQTLILTLHIIVCVLLVILVLLQSGKEGMGVIFGGGNSSVFGSGGAGGILAKLTTLMAVIFVITSLSYTYVTSARPTAESAILSVKIEDTGNDKAAEAPGAPKPDQEQTPSTAPVGEAAPADATGDNQDKSAATGKAATASDQTDGVKARQPAARQPQGAPGAR